MTATLEDVLMLFAKADALQRQADDAIYKRLCNRGVEDFQVGLTSDFQIKNLLMEAQQARFQALEAL